MGSRRRLPAGRHARPARPVGPGHAHPGADHRAWHCAATSSSTTPSTTRRRSWRRSSTATASPALGTRDAAVNDFSNIFDAKEAEAARTLGSHGPVLSPEWARAHPARLADVPGAGRPRSRRLRRADGTRAARPRARDRARRARPPRRREAALPRAAAARPRRAHARTSSGRTSSFRPGSDRLVGRRAARRHRPRPRRAQRRCRFPAWPRSRAAWFAARRR